LRAPQATIRNLRCLTIFSCIGVVKPELPGWVSLPLSHLTEPRVDITPALTGLAQARWPYARARGLASTVQRLVEVALVTL